jgi:hypothetical protein
VTFADIISRLRSLDEEPFDGQAPAIYVAEPWLPTSEAVVEWSGEKGGIPFNRKPLLYYLITVREALQFFGPDYDDLAKWRSGCHVCQAWPPHHPEECAASLPPTTRHHITLKGSRQCFANQGWSR